MLESHVEEILIWYTFEHIHRSEQETKVFLQYYIDISTTHEPWNLDQVVSLIPSLRLQGHDSYLVPHLACL